jgi:hypothetical protein
MLLIFAVLPGNVMAVSSGSTVNAEVCDGSLPPVIAITNPQSDSIVNQSIVTLSGNTVRTTQLDIFINNQYASSAAVDSSQTFSIQVGLNRGTNTIRLKAIYSCNNTTTDETVVVTYEPSSTPGSGAETSTVTITPSDPGPGIISNPTTARNYQDERYERAQIDNRDGKTLLERAGSKLGFSRADGKEWEYDFTQRSAIKTVWLLLATATIALVVLKYAQFVWLLGYCGFTKKSAGYWRNTIRFIALLLSFLFVILFLA